ncbi:MAG: DUF1501 domain-containing protein [Planctomycetota bacterium]|nr:MAG: DUF1501 domain-containing protein [Planctomycetota bacterium]REK28971.1 MAG: DUF1501 domain-containing protein [Planctomycetota bacterium]REK39595.1 MAG: DUF1501 domain-containing protein [Planctomycetota bacterium]
MAIDSSRDFTRRRFLGTTALGAGAAAADMTVLNALKSPVLADELKQQDKRVILLWLAGGASQFETWDPKPGAPTGGPFARISTNVPGIEVCELLPKLAQRMQHTAVIRSLNTRIADHGGGYKLMETGRRPETGVEFPHLGALVARELGRIDSQVPDHVSMYTSTEGRRKGTPGFLGARYGEMFLTENTMPENIRRLESISSDDHADRAALRKLLADRFARDVPSSSVNSQNSAYERVRGLMASDHLFDIEQEPTSMRDMYGPTQLGQQCLIARRLIEAGTPFVKVARAWWDSHGQNFETHRELCADLDHSMSALLDDLANRGLLESTLVITLGEFGRTPNINGSLGRDHFANAWSCSLSGCGVKGGTAYGKTDENGQTVVEGETGAGDLFATIFSALGVEYDKEYMLGSRPIPLSDFGSEPIEAVLA